MCVYLGISDSRVLCVASVLQDNSSSLKPVQIETNWGCGLTAHFELLPSDLDDQKSTGKYADALPEVQQSSSRGEVIPPPAVPPLAVASSALFPPRTTKGKGKKTPQGSNVSSNQQRVSLGDEDNQVVKFHVLSLSLSLSLCVYISCLFVVTSFHLINGGDLQKKRNKSYFAATTRFIRENFRQSWSWRKTGGQSQRKESISRWQ